MSDPMVVIVQLMMWQQLTRLVISRAGEMLGKGVG